MFVRFCLSQYSVDLLPVSLERVKTDLMSVWETADEGTEQLYELDHQQEDAEDGVDLGDACLPEGEVGGEVLGRDCQHLQVNPVKTTVMMTGTSPVF